VLSRISFFTIEKNATTPVDLVLREDKGDISVLGNIDAEAKYVSETDGETTVLKTSGRGYFIIGLLGVKQEPTNHALNDIRVLKADFETWNRSIILLFKSQQEMQLFDKQEFPGLPTTVSYGIDTEGKIMTMIADAINLTDRNQLPVFIIADTFGRVVFVSQGYTIGLGEQMMKVIKNL